MIISHDIRPFRYEGIALSECLWVDGRPCFTAAAIREFLGLKKNSAVQEIVRHNPQIEKYSKEIETVQQKDQKNGDHMASITPSDRAKNTQKYVLKVYNPVGFWLIVFKARTPRAEQCQLMAAVIMDAFISGKLVQRDPEQAATEQILDDYLKSGCHKEKDLLMARVMLAADISRTSFFRWVKIYRGNRSPFDRQYKGNTRKPQIAGEIEAQIRGLFIQNPLIGAKELWRNIGSPKQPNCWAVQRFHKKLADEYYARMRPALGSGIPAGDSIEKGA